MKSNRNLKKNASISIGAALQELYLALPMLRETRCFHDVVENESLSQKDLQGIFTQDILNDRSCQVFVRQLMNGLLAELRQAADETAK